MSVTTNVYVRDDAGAFEWLPAVVLEKREERALVRLDIPGDFFEHTEVVVASAVLPQTGDERWVELCDYHNHTLPLRDDHDGGNNVSLSDFATLTHIHEASVLYRVKDLIRNEQPFIRCNQELILAIDPEKHSKKFYSLEYQKMYLEQQQQDAKEEKKESDESDVSRPHIYEVPSRAHRNLMTDSQNQAIYVVGEGASGKTETTRALLEYLVAQGTLRHSELNEQLRHAATIFRAFGNAKTFQNPSSTRFAQKCSLEYDVDGGLVGANFNTYMLEATRVTNSAKSNFHIFYQMLNASPSTKAEVLGPDWEQALTGDFAYLREPDENPGDWGVTSDALAFFGWQGLPLQRLMQALSVTLLLGNVEFGETDGFAMVESLADLNMVALSLGVPIDALELALTNQVMKTTDGSETIGPYNIDQARRACDSLARVLYDCIFASVVRQINILTCAPPAVTGKRQTISVVDIFGFENQSVNQLETLCINYANEKVHQRYISEVFRHQELAEGEAESPQLESISNIASLRLIDGTRGVIKTLREECGRANGSNENFLCKLKLGNKASKSFISEQTQTSFGILHSSGTVTYNVERFVESAIEKIPQHLLDTIAKSTNGLVSYEISELMQSPNISQNKRTKSVFDRFRRQLKDLLASLENSRSHFIRCIKTSDTSCTTRADHGTILRQLQCAGIVTKVELSRPLYNRELELSAVESNYGVLVPVDTLEVIRELPLPDKIQLMLSVLFAPTIEKFRSSTFDMPFVCGKKKAFFRTGAVEVLEARLEASAYSSTVIANWWQCQNAACKYKKQLYAGRYIVNWARAKSIQRKYREERDAARCVTIWIHGRLQRIRFIRMRAASRLIQEWFVSHLRRRKFIALVDEGNRLSDSSMFTLSKGDLLTVPEHGVSANISLSEGGSGRSHRDATYHDSTIDYSCFEEEEEEEEEEEGESEDDNESCVLVPKTVLHETEQLKRRVVDLNQNIVQVTEEAELHNEEIAADFEDRLVGYEQEVMQLKEQIHDYEQEKTTLKEEVNANVENIKSLKNGIRTMQESHREYLNRVIRAIEKANSEHEESIRVIKKDRDQIVFQLETEIRRMKKRQQIYEMTKGQRSEHFHALARKLEKITSPNYIAEKVEACDNGNSLLDNLEKNVSSKARNILYRLEDLESASNQGRCLQGSDDTSCIEILQQRLIDAYEQIEDLKVEAKRKSGAPTKTKVKAGIRRIFDVNKK